MDNPSKIMILKENLDEIYKLRKNGFSNEKIAENMSQGFNVKINAGDIAKLIKKEEIKAFAYGSDDRRERANFELQELSNRYKKATDMVDWLVDSIEKIKDGLSNLPPEEYAIKFIKLTPVIISTSKEIINQLEFVKKQQEQMAIEQQNMILSPIEVNIQMTKKLKDWAEKGYIKILKVIPDKSEQNEKENKQENTKDETCEEIEQVSA